MAKHKRSQRGAQPGLSKGRAQNVRQQGLQAFQAGRYEGAIAIWSPLAPHDARVRVALAEAHFRRALRAASPSEQLVDLRRAAGLQPSDARFQYHLGLALHRSGEIQAAIDQYGTVPGSVLTQGGAARALTLASLEQDARVDIATLPGSTPALQAKFAPAQALLRGAQPESQGDGPMEQLWRGLGLILAGDTAARDVLADNRSLPGAQAGVVRRYYQGVAAAQAGDSEAALSTWQRLPEDALARPWVRANLVVAYLQRLESDTLEHELDSALATAQEALALAPANAALAATLVRTLDRGAQSAAAGGDWARATALWEDARQVVSASSGLGSPRPLLHNLALAYETREEWQAAAETWRAMLRTRPRKASAASSTAVDPQTLGDAQWAWVRRRVVECYKRAGLPGEAVVIFRQAIKADPGDLETRLQLVDAYVANEQTQAAANELQRVLEIEPGHVEARIRLSAIYGAQGAWYAAEQLLRDVLAQQPEREDVRRQMARLLLEQGLQHHSVGFVDGAARAFEEGQQYAPEDYHFPLNLARVAIDRRQVEQAHELAERVLRMGTDQPDAYLQVIDCWAVANQLDKARDVLARAERALTLTLDFYCSLGVLLLTRHAPPARMNPLAIPARQAQPTDGAWVELATELLDRAVALDPEDAQTRLRIATELMSIRPDLALRYAEEGVRLAPADPRTLMLLGLLLGLNERSREAKDVMRRAARLARQQGDQELARNIDSLRQQVDSPFLSMLLRLGPLVEDLDLDDEPFW